MCRLQEGREAGPAATSQAAPPADLHLQQEGHSDACARGVQVQPAGLHSACGGVALRLGSGNSAQGDLQAQGQQQVVRRRGQGLSCPKLAAVCRDPPAGRMPGPPGRRRPPRWPAGRGPEGPTHGEAKPVCVCVCEACVLPAAPSYACSHRVQYLQFTPSNPPHTRHLLHVIVKSRGDDVRLQLVQVGSRPGALARVGAVAVQRAAPLHLPVGKEHALVWVHAPPASFGMTGGEEAWVGSAEHGRHMHLSGTVPCACI